MHRKHTTFSSSTRLLSLVTLMLMSLTALAQEKITGSVKDAGGTPLIGVNVVEAGTANGTVTDIDGNYSITVKPDSKLRFSYLGYIAIEAMARPGMVVTMQEDNKDLSEIVVVGYGSMRRKDVTSSITSIKSEELNTGIMTTPSQMLQGKVPGLVVTTGGNPNATPTVTLRGASTLRTGEAQSPYYVVDGVPGVDLSLVSADDIESIDILRDATATAIYGSKAANGVIIITTKKGKGGSAHVAYSGYAAVESVAKTMDLATAADLRAYAAANDFELPGDEGADTDWQDEVQRTGVSHSHNLAVSGGGDRSNYNVSLNYLKHEGVIRGTDMERLTARALAQATVLKDHLTVALGVNASHATANEVPSDQQGQSVADAMVYYSPTQPVKNEDGSWFRSTSVSQYYNPLSMINEDTQKTVRKRMQLTGKADVKFIEGMTWTTDFSYMTDQSTASTYHSTKSQIVNTNGQATRNTYFGDKRVFETYINFNRTLADRHRLGVMAGYSWEETNNNDGFGVTVKNFYNDAVKYYNLTYANEIDGIDGVESGAESTLRMISFYGRLNYSFADRYNIQATIRRDGSSAFGKNNRWATFPSVSAAWRLSEEGFMKDLDLFDDLKIHAGYGVSGNSLGFDAYTALVTYGATGWFQYTDANGVSQNMHTIGAGNNANPDLKWERTGMFNVGIDFTILGGRLGGTIEYYDKRTSDLIYYYPVSTNRYPYGTMTANVGDISNKGIEFSINATPVKTGNFAWNTTFNISHNKNRVEKLSNQTYSVSYIQQADANIAGSTGVYVQRIMEGCPIGQFYTYEWAGLNEDGVSQFYVHDPETGLRTGETTIQPTETDQIKTGSAQPKVTYGWDNTLSLRRWSLNLFFQGVGGNKIFNAMRAQYNTLSLISQGKNVLKEALTDQKYGDVNAQYPSDRYLENGSYLRLSTLTLSYDFGKLGDWLDRLSIYATVNNVFTITGYEGTDPEVELGGLTPGIQWRDSYYPHTRTFMFGLKANL